MVQKILDACFTHHFIWFFCFAFSFSPFFSSIISNFPMITISIECTFFAFFFFVTWYKRNPINISRSWAQWKKNPVRKKENIFVMFEGNLFLQKKKTNVKRILIFRWGIFVILINLTHFVACRQYFMRFNTLTIWPDLCISTSIFFKILCNPCTMRF